jgi:hypothetical protein
MSYERVNARFSEAIEAMATSFQPSIQQRLAIAYMFHLGSVEPDELPIEVESQFRAIKDKLTRIPGKDGTGTIVATTDAMSAQEALGIAKELVHISHIVAAEHHRLELLDYRLLPGIRRH